MGLGVPEKQGLDTNDAGRVQDREMKGIRSNCKGNWAEARGCAGMVLAEGACGNVIRLQAYDECG